MRKIWILFLLILIFACQTSPETGPAPNKVTQVVKIKKNPRPTEKYKELFSQYPSYRADGFDYPVGKPNAKGYYNAQGFGGKHHHLGDDWNAKTGGNTDLGHPIYSVAHGYVSSVKDHGGGWGPVLRIVHELDGELVESLYAHCQEIFVKTGDWVKRGDKVATIGNNNGQYYAHLHLELREKVDMPLGGGYSKESEGYLDPTIFIKANRPD